MSDSSVSLDEAVESIGFGRLHAAMLCAYCIVQFAESMEFHLVTLIAPTLRYHWQLTSFDVTLISTVSVLGLLLGPPLAGSLCDRYGRLTLLRITSLLATYFSLLSIFVPNLPWLLAIRFLACMFAAMLPSSVDITVMEVFPLKWRARSVCISMMSAAVGGLVEALAAIFVLADGPSRWRLLMLVNTLPVLAAVVAGRFFPESPRYLLVSGRHEDATRVVNRIAAACGARQFASVRPESDVSAACQERASLKSLFGSRRLLRLTFSIGIMAFTAQFVYFGSMLLSSEIIRKPHTCLQNFSMTSASFIHFAEEKEHCDVSGGLRTVNTVAIATAGEIFGSTIVALIVNSMDRRYLYASSMIITAINFTSLGFCMPLLPLQLLLCLLRCLSSAQYTLMFVMLMEAYPTTLRSMAVGLVAGWCRFGSLLSPLVTQMLYSDGNSIAALAIFIVSCFICVLAVAAIETDTRDRLLAQTTAETGRTAVMEEALCSPREEEHIMADYKTFSID